MNPIIDPFYVYLIGTLPQISDNIQGIFVVLLITSAISFGITSMNLHDVKEDSCISTRKFRMKSIIAFFSSLFVIFITSFIPTKETMIEMSIASQVTPKNIEIATKAGKDVTLFLKEQMIDVIKEVKTSKSAAK